jgi:hypothetical protein
LRAALLLYPPTAAAAAAATAGLCGRQLVPAATVPPSTAADTGKDTACSGRLTALLTPPVWWPASPLAALPATLRAAAASGLLAVARLRKLRASEGGPAVLAVGKGRDIVERDGSTSAGTSSQVLRNL